jgi:hypothetical protein
VTAFNADLGLAAVIGDSFDPIIFGLVPIGVRAQGNNSAVIVSLPDPGNYSITSMAWAGSTLAITTTQWQNSSAWDKCKLYLYDATTSRFVKSTVLTAPSGYLMWPSRGLAFDAKRNVLWTVLAVDDPKTLVEYFGSVSLSNLTVNLPFPQMVPLTENRIYDLVALYQDPRGSDTIFIDWGDGLSWFSLTGVFLSQEVYFTAPDDCDNSETGNTMGVINWNFRDGQSCTTFSKVTECWGTFNASVQSLRLCDGYVAQGGKARRLPSYAQLIGAF